MYENILYLVEEIESKGTDDQNYWQQTQKDLESLTQEAEKWKLKVGLDRTEKILFPLGHPKA